MTAVRVWAGGELYRITGLGYDPVVRSTRIIEYAS